MYASVAAIRPVRRAGLILAGMVGLAACVVFYYFDPSDHAASRYFPPCMFHAVTHLNCPGCGSQRAIHYLLHGRIAQALAMNALLVISIPFLIGLALRPDWARKTWVGWTIFGVTLTYWIVRNIPVWPFTFLAPHHMS